MKKIYMLFLSGLFPVSLLLLCIFFLSLYGNSDSAQKKASPGSSQKSEASYASVPENKSSEKSADKNKAAEAENEEMRGVWVPYMSLDMSGTDRSEKAFTDRVDTIFDRIRSIGGNTVIFHVRPFCDALYDSKLFPSSHILSGAQGKDPGYDALSIAVREAHERGLSIHAWVNPLRVTLPDTPAVLAENNPSVKWRSDKSSKNDRYVLEYEKSTWLNPAYPEVRRLIIDGVRELLEYDIDGVQIDDYFYPTEKASFDSKEYKSYKSSAGKTALSQKEWRMKNICTLVQGIYAAVHKKRGCVFGIAPQCNIENDMNSGADVRTWCSVNGYADYICPQAYVSMEHPVFPFCDVADTWKKLVTAKGMKLYFGLALYKAGTDADSGTWLSVNNNLSSQIEYGRKLSCGGFIIYSAEQLDDKAAQKELKGVKKKWR